MQKTSATLLIIDDDEVVRASLAAYLEDSGFSVLQASNGLQGLQVFERDKPDLVICDLRMPQVGGLELIRQVTDIAPQTPVIVVSGAGVMNDAVEALRLGAADYLIKPLEDLAVLEHSVRRALDRARLLLENQRYREKLETANRELEASLNLLQEDQNAGRQVQMNMLPVSPWSIDEFKFAHQIIPSLYLSGDFVDYFRVDERRVAFYLADVSGHGADVAEEVVDPVLHELRGHELIALSQWLEGIGINGIVEGEDRAVDAFPWIIFRGRLGYERNQQNTRTYGQLS
jgi:phosphoserine phosphatase RsbU/P